MTTLSARTDPSFGRRIGKYTVLASLGEGGMANVYLASTHGPAGFTKLVVVKILRTSLTRADDLVEMFLSEARLAARLNHPNVVQTNEVAAEDGAYYMTMEYLEGQALSSIAQRVAKTGSTFPLPHHLRVLADALAGLEYAHNAQDFDGTPLRIVHRDVSPHNVFVTYDGVAKVLDFGIAKATGTTVHTETGVLRGKIAYMAPEQISGAADLDRRADIFSVGVMLWEALTGKRFRKGRNDLAILNSAINEEAPSPREVNPEVDPELERICLKALARERDARYANAHEMQTDIEAVLDRMGPPRTTTREVGARVADMFKDDRTQMRAAIEAQMANPDQSIPQMRAEGATLTPSAVSGGTKTPDVSASRVVEKTQPRALLYFATGAVVVGAVAFFALRGRQEAPVPAPAASIGAAPVVAAPTSTSSAAPASIVVSVRATPGSARIFIDGAPVTDNPHIAHVTLDRTHHTIRAEAAGYSPSEESVVYDHDAVVSLELAREQPRGGPWRPAAHAPAPRPAQPSAPTGAATPAPSPAPTPAAAPANSGEPHIDMENPYGK